MQNFTLNVVCPAITVTPGGDGRRSLSDGVRRGGLQSDRQHRLASFTWGATGLPAGLAHRRQHRRRVRDADQYRVERARWPSASLTTSAARARVNTTLTVRPTTDNENYTGGVGNTQYVVGAVVPSTPNVFFNDNVKIGDSGPGTLTVTFPATSPNGVIAEGAADGTFIYTPNVGFAGPTDTFTYTLTDGNGVTNTGTVTINLSRHGVVRQQRRRQRRRAVAQLPFNALNNAAAASAAGSFIYVHSSVVPTPGNLAMDANQTLHGQGAIFTLNNLTIPSGTQPTLSGTVTLANNDVVRAMDFSPSGIPAMTASALTGPVTIDQVNVTGGTNGLSLTNVSGAVTVTNDDVHQLDWPGSVDQSGDRSSHRRGNHQQQCGPLGRHPEPDQRHGQFLPAHHRHGLGDFPQRQYRLDHQLHGRADAEHRRQSRVHRDRRRHGQRRLARPHAIVTTTGHGAQRDQHHDRREPA